VNVVRAKRDVPVCELHELPPGARVIRDVEGRSIGVFNVDGHLYALHNRCPHRGAPLCQGRLTGTTVGADDHGYRYGREGRILRCVWHGWEFDVETGCSLVEPRVRTKTFPAFVRDGRVFVTI
jgi:nitrite reductase (NADH) small subunit